MREWAVDARGALRDGVRGVRASGGGQAKRLGSESERYMTCGVTTQKLKAALSLGGEP